MTPFISFSPVIRALIEAALVVIRICLSPPDIGNSSLLTETSVILMPFCLKVIAFILSVSDFFTIRIVILSSLPFQDGASKFILSRPTPSFLSEVSQEPSSILYIFSLDIIILPNLKCQLPFNSIIDNHLNRSRTSCSFKCYVSRNNVEYLLYTYTS